jgi:hypothetical protein
MLRRDRGKVLNVRRQHMHPKLVTGLSAGILGMSFVATQVSAHHGWAGQGDEDFTLKGTVSKAVSLSGPHASMQIKDEKGQVWDLTLAPPPRTQAAGLEEAAIPVGSEVTILGKRSMDPKKFEVKTERVTFNGKNFDVYPNRL